jgi:excisionase family DNA binding protein
MLEIKGYKSIRETSVILGIHYQTVRSWIKKGFLKSYRPTGKKIYVSVKSINALLYNRKKEDADGN